MIRLRVLGTTSCTDTSGKAVPGAVRSPKRLALLSYIAIHRPGEFHRRDVLLGLFWPESNQRRARGALRQLLRHLRSDLGDAIVSRGQEEVGIDTERLWCDAIAFQESLDTGRLAEALDLYRGDLLEGFHLTGAPEFERWQEETRPFLRRRATEAAWALAECAGDPADAIRWARRAAVCSPLDELAARRLMDFLVERGDQIGALREYERFSKLVHDQMGVAPGSETQALASRIRNQADSARPAPINSPTLVEPVIDTTAEQNEPRRAALPLDAVGSTSDMSHAIEPPPVTRTTPKQWVTGTILVAGISLAIILTFGARHILDGRPAGIIVGDSRRLTIAEGTEIDPVLSPDATHIAYAAGAPGAMEIYVRRTAGGREIALTERLPGNHRWPTWSPDGERLAFVTWGQEGATSLHVIPVLGGPVRRVHDEPTMATAIVSPTWSPDGGRIAFKVERELSVLDLETGDIVPIAEGTAPHSLTWGPAGAIAFVSGNSGYALGPEQLGNIAPSSIWVVPHDGGEPVPVVADGMLNQSPAWGPEGRRLLFVSNRDGPRDVYSVDLSGRYDPVGEPIRLTTHLDPLTIDLSADGDRLVYSKLEFDTNIYTLQMSREGPVDFVDAVRLTRGHQVIETISLSPDMRWIAFDSNRDGNQDIYRMPASGGEALKLTRHEADDFAPRWSPDGREIAFYSFRNGHRDIYIVDVDGRRAERVTTDPGSDAFPDWRPDGRALVYQHTPVDGRADVAMLHVIERASNNRWGNPRKLIEHPSWYGRWSPRGDQIAFADWAGLYLMRLATGEQRTIDARERTGFWPIWSRDGETLYFKVQLGTDRGIWAFDIDGAKLRQVLTDADRRSFRAAFDTDGQRLFFLGVDAEEADIWVAELEWP